MTLAIAPITSAAGLGSLDEEDRTALRTAFEECRDSSETREEAKECLTTVAEEYGLDLHRGFFKRRHERREHRQDFLADIAEDAREELKACHEDNQGDREAMKTCAQEVAEEYDFELPEPPEREGPFANMPEKAREALKACREDNEGDREAMKACAKGVADEYGFELPRHQVQRKIQHFRSTIQNIPEEDRVQVRSDLRNCRDEDNREDVKACMQEVLAPYEN